MSRLVRLLVAGVVAAGAAAVAIRLPQLGSWHGKDLLAFALLVAATVAGEQLRVSVRFGEQTKHVTMTETAYAAALLLGVRTSAITLAVLVGIAGVYSVRRIDAHKVAFNAGSYLAAVTAAEFVFAAARPLGAVAAVPAMAAFFAVNACTVVGVIALVESRSFGSVFAPIARLEFGHAGVNLTAGMLLATAWVASPIAIAVLATVPAVAVTAYRRLQPALLRP